MTGGAWRLVRTRARLMSRITPTPDGCWQWNRLVNRDGYGMTSYRGRRGTLAHRALYMEMVGPIPDGMTIDHTCHNVDKACPGGPTCGHRRCVNPAHLEPVPLNLNNERARQGRPTPLRPGFILKTHCPAGHAYTPENTRTYDGRRFCIACNRAAKVAYRERRRASR